MTTSPAFDTYSLRARLQPGFLAVLPAVVNAYLLWNMHAVTVIWPIAVAAGGTFFLANLIRSRGIRVQSKLIQQWDGLPTTRALRLNTSGINPVLRDRRRSQIQRVTNLRLPTHDEEAAESHSADTIYQAATRILITKVREKPDIYPRVQDENTHYGFRRNLYSLKPIALTILALVGVGCVVAGIRDGVTTSLIVAVTANVVVFTAWVWVITPSWVQQVGEQYAERLFDALEQLSSTPPAQ